MTIRLSASQYLLRIPLAASHRGVCYYCARRLGPTFQSGLQELDSRTRDHILAAEYGGRYHAQNCRWCCQGCNVLRGKIGHCCAVLMLILGEMECGISQYSAVLRVTGIDPIQAERARRVRHKMRRRVVRQAMNYGV